MKRTLLAIIAAGFALSACATDVGLREAQRLSLYRAHAGAPVQHFDYFGNLNSWTPLGDSALAIWTRPNRAYLLEMNGRCPDLDFTPAVGLTSQFHRVYARFDSVIVRNTGGIPTIPCRISTIRPLDVKAIKQAEREARATAKK